MMIAIRGAITIAEDKPAEIKKAMDELIIEIFSQNDISQAEIINIIFSSTADIKSYYPARAFREMGYDDIPLFSCQEPEIENSLELCIRVLIQVEKEKEIPVRHIYLGAAKNLRPDLVEEPTDE